jgi:hypothetical protein
MHIRQTVLILLLSFSVGMSRGLAQKIEASRANRDQIIRLETALNHLTVIEVSEPVRMVAVGSPSFKVERRDNKVFIQPLEQGQSTNLFIWTPTARYSYELAPAGSVTGMHFAIDLSLASIPEGENRLEVLRKTAAAVDSNAVTTRALVGSVPVRSKGAHSTEDRVAVVLKDVLKMQDRMLIRYSIQNRGSATYQIDPPEVILLREPKSQRSLRALSLTQLNGKEARRIQKKGKTPLTIIQTDMQSRSVKPGDEVIGVVGIELISPSSDPTVLELQFPADQKGRVIATLVL